MLGRVHGAEHPAGRDAVGDERSSGTVNHTALVVSDCGGRSRSTTSISSLVDVRLRWYATTWFVTSTVPRWREARADRHRLVRATRS